MSEPYIGEIRMVGFNFAPVGWMLCNGQILSISQYTALYTIIGTTYGGDGQTTFALPNLQSRVPMHQGNGFVLGESSGTETVTLTTAQMPSHTHPPQVNASGGNTNNPAGNFWANWTGSQYSDQGTNAAMNAGTTNANNGGQPHDNMLPYLTINFVISLFGVYPSQG